MLDLEHKLDVRTHELKNALDQQAAISEILRVISSSPTDVQPVLDAVAKNAAQLCDAQVAGIFIVEGETMKPVASYAGEGGSTPNWSDLLRSSVDRSPAARLSTARRSTLETSRRSSNRNFRRRAPTSANSDFARCWPCP